MSKPRTVKQKQKHEIGRGPRSREVLAGEADSNGVSKGNIFFSRSRKIAGGLEATK